MYRFLRIVALLTALTALVTACSSDQASPRTSTTTSEPDGSEPTTTTSTTTTAPPFTADPVDWNNRSAVDISLPTGWRLTACDGDAPFLCASTSDGTIDGTVMLVEYPMPRGAASPEEVEADAEELYRVTEEDRRITCGAAFDLQPDPFVSVTVAGKPGHRYGFQLRDEEGAVTERVVLHVVDDGSRRVVISTAFSDADGCPGEDPERNEFPVAAFAEIEPYLDQIMATSILPTIHSGPS